jgi:high affinity sulfate transporter 1
MNRSILIQSVLEYLPGIRTLLTYRLADLPDDLRAGLTVAAIALPISFANAQIAGFSPIVGLYAFLLPMAVYFFLGTSRHLIIGPDAATAALVASAIGPMAAGDPQLYAALAITLGLMVGVICLVASLMQLGGIADFLSRPILMGFLHGIAIALIVDQIPTLMGFQSAAADFIPSILEIARNIDDIHVWTLGLSAACAVMFVWLARQFPKVPAALVLMAISALLVVVFDLESKGVTTIGSMAAGLPSLSFDGFKPEFLKQMLGVAVGVATVSYAGVILDARVFATRNQYDINPDREFAALGASQIASAVSGGFCVGSLDSGAPLVEAAGGRTKLAGLISVGAMIVVVSLFMPLLRHVPSCALAVIVLSAAWAMTDLPYLRSLLRMSREEFVVAMVAMLGVILLGAVDAIVMAVGLALLRFLRQTSRPKVEILGKVKDTSSYHAIDRHQDAKLIDGLAILRFSAPIIFFNAPYFRKSVRTALKKGGPKLNWLILDLIPVSQIDVTGWHTLIELTRELDVEGIRLSFAGRQSEVRDFAQREGIDDEFLSGRIYPTIELAVKAFQTEFGKPKKETSEKRSRVEPEAPA